MKYQNQFLPADRLSVLPENRKKNHIKSVLSKVGVYVLQSFVSCYGRKRRCRRINFTTYTIFNSFLDWWNDLIVYVLRLMRIRSTRSSTVFFHKSSTTVHLVKRYIIIIRKAPSLRKQEEKNHRDVHVTSGFGSLKIVVTKYPLIYPVVDGALSLPKNLPENSTIFLNTRRASRDTLTGSPSRHTRQCGTMRNTAQTNSIIIYCGYENCEDEFITRGNNFYWNREIEIFSTVKIKFFMITVTF